METTVRGGENDEKEMRVKYFSGSFLLEKLSIMAADLSCIIDCLILTQCQFTQLTMAYQEPDQGRPGPKMEAIRPHWSSAPP